MTWIKIKKMKHTIMNIIIFFVMVVFIVIVHHRTYVIAYAQGYQQAIKDEIDYIQSQTDSIKGEIKILDRAIEKYRALEIILTNE